MMYVLKALQGLGKGLVAAFVLLVAGIVLVGAGIFGLGTFAGVVLLVLGVLAGLVLLAVILGVFGLGAGLLGLLFGQGSITVETTRTGPLKDVTPRQPAAGAANQSEARGRSSGPVTRRRDRQ